MAQAGDPSSTNPERLEVIGRTIAALEELAAQRDTERMNTADPGLLDELAREEAEIWDRILGLEAEAQWLTPQTPAVALALTRVLLGAVDAMLAERPMTARPPAADRRFERVMGRLIDGLAAMAGAPPPALGAGLDAGPRRRALDELIARAWRPDHTPRDPTSTVVVPLRAARRPAA